MKEFQIKKDFCAIFHNKQRNIFMSLLSCSILLLLIIPSSQNSLNSTNTSQKSSLIPHLSGVNLQFSTISSLVDIDSINSTGNSNGRLDAGETIQFRISLFNTGDAKATNVFANISGSDPYLRLLWNHSSFVLINVNSVGSSASYFRIRVNSSCPALRVLTFNLTIGSDQGIWSDKFNMTVYGTPNVGYAGFTVQSESKYDLEPIYNQIVNAGEQISLNIQLRNVGSATLFDVKGWISINDPYIVISDNYNDFYDLVNDGDQYSGSFTIKISGACPDKYLFNLNLTLQDRDFMSLSLIIPIRVNGTAMYRFIELGAVFDSYSYENDKDLLIDAGETWKLNVTLENYGDAAGSQVWVFITSDDPYITFEYDESDRNRTLYELSYSSYFPIGILAMDEENYWEFSVSSNAPQNHQIIFRIQIGDSSNNQSWIFTDSLTITDGVSGFTLGGVVLDINFLLAIICLISFLILYRSKPKKHYGWRIFGLIVSFICFVVFLMIWLAKINVYFLYLLIPTFYCTIIGIACSKSRVIRNNNFHWKIDQYKKRKADKKAQKIQQKEQEKQKRLSDIENQKNMYVNLLSEAQKNVTNANKLESDKNFKGALSVWTQTLDCYEKALKKAPTSEDQTKIKTMVNNVKINIGMNHFNQAIQIKTMAKAMYLQKKWVDAKKQYEEAIKEYSTGLELFKKISELPIDLNLTQFESAIQKYTQRIERINIELIIENGIQVFQQAKKAGETQNTLEQGTRFAKDAIQIYAKAKGLAESKPEFSDLISIIQENLRQAQELRKALDDKLDALLGIIPTSKLVADLDQDSEVYHVETKILPVNEDLTKNHSLTEKNIQILREYEFIAGKIRFKVKLINAFNEVLTNLKMIFDIPDALKWIAHEPDYERKGDAIYIPKLGADETKTISIYLTPINCFEGKVNMSLSYFDGHDQPHVEAMAPKSIAINCPLFFTPETANLARVKSLQKRLSHHDRKVLPVMKDISAEEFFNMAVEQATQHDVKLVDNEFSVDDQFGEAWLYGVTKVKQQQMIINIQLNMQDGTLFLEISGDHEEAITSLLAELENQLRLELQKKYPHSAAHPLYDVEISVMLGHCPYCYSELTTEQKREYQQHQKILCKFCQSLILSYDL